MSVSIPTTAPKFFEQRYTVAGEKFACECFREDDGTVVVDIFHSTNDFLTGCLFVDYYEGDDIRSLESYLANEVVPNLDTLVAESIAARPAARI